MKNQIKTSAKRFLCVHRLQIALLLGASVLVAHATDINLALNTNRTGFPSPLASDTGWGGGSDPWQMVDGLSVYSSWPGGLAFTGGNGNWGGQPCGSRQATIDFGASRTFHKVVVWTHGDEHVPAQAAL